MDDLDKAMAAVERMRKMSRRAAAVARIGSGFLKVFKADIEDAFDIQKARARNHRDAGCDEEEE